MNKIETIEVFGKKGTLKINKSELTAWAKKGYSTKKPETGNQNIDFSKYSDEQILEFAAKVGVPGTVTKRETIIKKLVEADFDPDKKE
jgi:hypothetical protein